METKWKKVMAAAILIGAVVMVQGCGSSTETSKSSSGGKVLKVATEAAYPPFRYMDKDKHLVGFEVDLAKEIARRMGAEIEWKDMSFGQLLDAVEEKKVDMAIGAITVTPEREKKVVFSDPYYKLSGYSLVVKKGNPPVGSENGLEGKVVAAKRGSTSEARAKALHPAQVISMDHYSDVFKAVESGKADVGIAGDQAAIYDLEHGGSERLTITGTLLTEDNFAIAVSKENAKLKTEVNEAMKSIINDGTYDKLTNKWFFAKAVDKE